MCHFNYIISNSDVFYQTPYDEFISINMYVSSFKVNDTAGSDRFTVNDISISYQYNKSIGDIAEEINNYLSNYDPSDDDDQINIPFKLGADKGCGLRIVDLEIEMDLIPDLHDLPSELTVDEDSHNLQVLDLYEVFSDDLTPDDEIEFHIERIGENFSKFDSNILESRYVSIDLYNGSSNDNWTGNIEIQISAVDSRGGRRATDPIQIQVLSVNDPPGISRDPNNHVVVQNNEWTYNPQAVDNEGDVVQYSISGPANMTINEMGIIHWIPNAWQIGEVGFSLTLSDGEDEAVFNFSIEVINTDDPPIFLTYPEPYYSVPFGETLILQFQAYDLDPDDQVSYYLTQGPNGGIINDKTGLFQWTPSFFSTDIHDCAVQAIDMTGLSAKIEFKVGISILDDPPEIISQGDSQLFDMTLWEYQIEIFDPDDDYYTIDLIQGPSGMFLNQVTDLLFWTPNIYQVGVFDISLLINSTNFKVYHNFTLDVSRSIREWELSLDSLEEFQRLKGMVNVKGTVIVQPSSVEKVMVKVGDGEWIEAILFQDFWSLELDSRKYSDGETEIQFIAHDGVEYSEPGKITVIIDNKEEKTSPLFFLLLLVIVLFLIIIGIFITLRLKRKRADKIDELKRLQKEMETKRLKQDLDSFLDYASSFQIDERTIEESFKEDL